MQKEARKIIEDIKKGRIKTKDDVDKAKRELAKTSNIKNLVPSSEILKYAKKGELQKLELLMRKPTRTISGVATVAVMPPPFPCPGRCVYCPQGENAPKSYTGQEPATRRAARNEYDPVRQVNARLKQLKAIGHSTDKIELIIMGGTFPAAPKKYQEDFVKGCFDALNGKTAKNLEQAQRINESAKNRCVACVIETRPDYCKQEHIDKMLKLGATKVELGVQTIFPEILEKVNRGHTIEDTIAATCLLKNNCFKVAYHIMPNLLSTPKQDVKMFKELFENPNLCPDELKIYPTLVIKGTKLYEMWKHGEYEPMNNEEMAKHIAKLKTYIPRYTRVSRVQRDIPANLIDAGVTASNLRELVHIEMKKLGLQCRCIRCREVGHRIYKQKIKVKPKNVKLISQEYEASNGTEVFLSYEDVKTDTLVGFIRLRINRKLGSRSEITDKTALIRELRVYGPVVPLGKRERTKWQHKSYGRQLLAEAERIAKEKFDKKKIIILSGIGAKQYYYKLGYQKEGPYVSKRL